MSKKLKATIILKGNKKGRKEAFRELKTLAKEDHIKFKKKKKNKMVIYLTMEDLEG